MSVSFAVTVAEVLVKETFACRPFASVTIPAPFCTDHVTFGPSAFFVLPRQTAASCPLPAVEEV